MRDHSSAGEEESLAARRGTAKIILFLGESPLVKRLKGDGSRGALVLIGGPEAVKAFSAAGTSAAPAAAAATSSETPRAIEAATPRPAAAQKAAPSPPEGAAHRYFSAKTPTPTPHP